MSKKCAKCEKTVYPTEELKCLDKAWHKACFKCDVCGMTLNMKTYKGYNKIPYCNSHYPQTKFTSVADTPENRRIAENTKIQSQVEYHKDFEKNIKGSKIEVADDPETRRIQQHGKVISQAEYKNIRGNRDEMEQRRSHVDQDPVPLPGQQQRRHIGSVADYDPEGSGDAGVKPSPYSSRFQGHSTAYPSSPPPQLPPPEPVRQPYYPAPAQPAPPQPAQLPPPQLPPMRAPEPAPAPPKAAQTLYQAMYDYDAQDEDEISFRDGDYIVDVDPIDEGWMYGTVQRTGKRGMLPANYVERIQ